MSNLSVPLRGLKRACRPTVLVLLLMGLILVTAVARFWPLGANGGTPAVPLPVPDGDQEVAWLSNATSTVAWERFVAAVRRVPQDVPDLGLKIADDSNAFPSQTTTTPELAVTIGTDKARLWFRWYKLTGDTGPAEWVPALCRRRTPPLAIIGGNTSDRARDLAHELNDLRGQLASPPLLLITTATADLV
ncbi:MAG: hypothetical protein JO112_21640, partial [Planctomycetes bacterium]|nr:hypothetical protein [Planctomycetota bacterium]